MAWKRYCSRGETRGGAASRLVGVFQKQKPGYVAACEPCYDTGCTYEFKCRVIIIDGQAIIDEIPKNFGFYLYFSIHLVRDQA